MNRLVNIRIPVLKQTVTGLLTILLLILMSPASSAQDAGSEYDTLVLGVDEAIEYALINNPDYLRAGVSLQLAELNFTYNASIFDPNFQADLNVNRTRTGGLSYESQVLSGSDSRVIDSEVSYSKLFHTGDALKLSFGSNQSSYASELYSEFGRLKTYTSALGLTYSRPILKGFGSAVTMAGIDRATVDITISKAVKDTARAELIYGVRSAYLRVLAAREAGQVAQLALTEAQSLFSETQAKVEAGLFAPYQEIAAEAGLYSREEELLRTRGEYEKALNGLRELLGAGRDVAIEIAEGAEFPVPDISAENAVEMALEARPDVRELRLRKKRAEVDLRIAQNSLKPELGFTSGFGFQGEDFDYTGSLNEMDNFSWFAGLSYIVPLGGNRAAVSQMRSAELAIADIELSLRAIEERVRREVSDALVELANATERLRVAKAGLEAAKVKVESEKERFKLGLITAGDLLEYEREYSQAQLAEVNARIELLRAASLLAKLTNADR